ncbi:helix-turn-helix domain-containing protein [Microbaculum marinisediminis]|uniref:Helix-turn-helix domain-containing protein n=1 Tax=Microbaculum marinisediminis TaxID=2931392 RepID=A0AAW5R0F3_9HYPH|nr:helix-turn-helix transcriptional regulator [Microbaculum sp. A6E488]MCT8972862.1 helix-turn-helix domain-containing protein [Microbaculum sp. A6E488]
MARRKASKPSTTADRVKSAREAAGLSTAQVARRLGVTTRTLASWENGRSAPRANRLFMLAGVLDVTPTWLIGGEGTVPPGGRHEIALLKGELKRLRSHHDEMGRLIERIEFSLDMLAQKTEQDS